MTTPAMAVTLGDRLRALELASARADMDLAGMAAAITDAVACDGTSRLSQLLIAYTLMVPPLSVELVERLRQTLADAEFADIAAASGLTP